MITQISVNAGVIWEYLDRKGEVELSDLLLSLSESKELLLMSLGWLVKEGHVLLTSDARNRRLFVKVNTPGG